jgi:cysteine-S-conjugate beta-lyase
VTNSDADPLLAEQRVRHSSAKWRTYDTDVLPAWVAEMDFPLADCITSALHDAIDRGDTGYRWVGDLPEAASAFYARHHGWEFSGSQVIVLADVLTAMSEVMRRLTPAGSAVVVTSPIYPPFFHVTQAIAGREVVDVPLLAGQLDLDGLAVAFARDDVSAFLMCHPHNPTGMIADRATLLKVAQLARAQGVIVISDEIWSPLTWGEPDFVPYLCVDPELTAPDVALVSASKAFNLAGLKCAQIVTGSSALADTLRSRIPMEITYGTGHLGVIASTAAYRDGDLWLAETMERIRENFTVLEHEVSIRIPQVGFQSPRATYLAWMDFRHVGLGDDPAKVLLEKGRLAVNPGHTFGDRGRGFVRVNLATDPVLVREMVARMQQSIEDS